MADKALNRSSGDTSFKKIRRQSFRSLGITNFTAKPQLSEIRGAENQQKSVRLEQMTKTYNDMWAKQRMEL